MNIIPDTLCDGLKEKGWRELPDEVWSHDVHGLHYWWNAVSIEMLSPPSSSVPRNITAGIEDEGWEPLPSAAAPVFNPQSAISNPQSHEPLLHSHAG